MMSVCDTILDALTRLGIAYELIEHEAAHTMEDLIEAERRLSATIPKNLFLTPRNLSAFYLCVVRPDARFRTADISKQIGSSRLSFGPEEQLMEYLRVTPGAISPLGLLFDDRKNVSLLIDEALRSIDMLAFHPNDNTRSLSMSAADFFDRFLPYTGHEPRFVRIATLDAPERM